MMSVKKFVKDNGLLLVFTALFLVCVMGQALAGNALYNETQAGHGLARVSCWQYLRTGQFLQGMFSNWQAAILQLASLIIFGVFLRQRGAPHSMQPGEPPGKSEKEGGKAGKRARERRPRRGLKQGNWVQRNSLSLAFCLLFGAVFVLHLASGARAYNEQRMLEHQPAMTVNEFLGSSKFWFTTLQTWEAEYMAIALYIFLSIFLRQEGSPESKPVDAPNSETGDPNE